MEVMPGRPRANTRCMLEALHQARQDGVQLLIFPEMAIPGYLIGDEWEREAFLRECEACAEEIRAATTSVIALFGSVAVDWHKKNEDGRVRKYNALFAAHQGRFIPPEHSPHPFVIKSLHPNYRQFDDSRHFFDLRKRAAELGVAAADLVQPLSIAGWRIGAVICEDAWHADYGFSPLAILKQRDIHLAINISASPYTFHKNRKRNALFAQHARELSVPLVCVNQTGLHNNGKTFFVCDGSSRGYDTHGHASPAIPRFEARPLTIEIRPGAQPQPWAGPVPTIEDGIADLYTALDYGTRAFMKLSRIDKVVVGISGGIDSAVAAAVYRRILPPEQLLLVSMPGPHTSGTTRQAAAQLAHNLDCLYAEVPIGHSVALTRRQLDGLVPIRTGSASSTRIRLSAAVLENIQARDRSARVLAALAAAFGGGFTCNANKAEMTVGYSTLYGDLGGFFANLADLWKEEIYALARHLNAAVYAADVIPSTCLTLPPSAELNAAQNLDAGQGDPFHYPYHDRLFRHWTESWNRSTPEDILRWQGQGELEEQLDCPGRIMDLFDGPADFVADLERWWNQYQGIGLIKRIQAPPVLGLKKRAFGFDHRESFIGPAYTRAYRQLKRRLLGE